VEFITGEDRRGAEVTISSHLSAAPHNGEGAFWAGKRLMVLVDGFYRYLAPLRAF